MVNWIKTIKRGVIFLVELVIAGVVAKYSGNNYWFAIAPVLEMVRNAKKHWQD